MFELIDECGPEHIRFLQRLRDKQAGKSETVEMALHWHRREYKGYRASNGALMLEDDQPIPSDSTHRDVMERLVTWGLVDGSSNSVRLTRRGEDLLGRIAIVWIMRFPCLPPRWKGFAVAVILVGLSELLWKLLSLVL